MEKNDRKETRRWPPWLTWGAVCAPLLGVAHLPDTIDQLKRWPEVFENVDTGTVLAIAFLFLLLAIAGLISWPLHYFLVERGARKLDRLEALAGEIREVERGIAEALEREDRMVPSGAVHQLKTKLEKMDIPTPPLPPPRMPMPRHKAQEWQDILIRMAPLAELRDFKGAKEARWQAEYEWRWFTETLAEKVANEKDAGKKADILESMAVALRKEVENGPVND